MSSEFEKTAIENSDVNFICCLPSLGITAFITTILTSIYKSCYRTISGKTEVERILLALQTTSVQQQANLSFSLFKSLSNSKNLSLNNVAKFLDGSAIKNVDHEKCVETIVRTKVSDKNSKLKKSLGNTLLQISNFGLFKNQVVEKQLERYNSECEQHEDLLLELWKNAGIGELEGRKSKQWQELGFQGNDPASDFRGGGILSLWCMVRYTRMNPDESRSFINKSRHPTTGYPYALVCINATQLLMELIHSGNIALRKQLYKIDREDLRHNVCLDLFGDIHTKVVYGLVKAWDVQEQLDLMKFADVRKGYKKKLEKELVSVELTH